MTRETSKKLEAIADRLELAAKRGQPTNPQEVAFVLLGAIEELAVLVKDFAWPRQVNESKWWEEQG